MHNITIIPIKSSPLVSVFVDPLNGPSSMPIDNPVQQKQHPCDDGFFDPVGNETYHVPNVEVDSREIVTVAPETRAYPRPQRGHASRHSQSAIEHEKPEQKMRQSTTSKGFKRLSFSDASKDFLTFSDAIDESHNRNSLNQVSATKAAVLKRRQITDIGMLARALNIAQDAHELNSLQDWAASCITWFQSSDIDEILVEQIQEYLSFSAIEYRTCNKHLICSWFKSLCDALGRTSKNEPRIVEALDIAVLSIDERVFVDDTDVLFSLSKTLLSKISHLAEFTKFTFDKHGGTFLTLDHTMIIFHRVTGKLIGQESEEGVYQIFMKLLKKIEAATAAYYPFRYQSKLIVQDLEHLVVGQSYHELLTKTVRRHLQPLSDSFSQTSEQEKQNVIDVACKNLHELFGSIHIQQNAWYAVIHALHIVGTKVLQKPETHCIVDAVFDALESNESYKLDKETRMAVRFGVISQLRMLVMHAPNEDLRSLMLKKLRSLTESANVKGWDDPEVFEAMLDGLHVMLRQTCRTKSEGHSVLEAVEASILEESQRKACRN